MRVDLSSLLMKVELGEADTNKHCRVPFFEPSLLKRPEFLYKNHLINLKETDLAMLNENLKHQEQEEAKRIAAEKAAATQSSQVPDKGKKGEVKGAAAKGGKDAKKGAAVVEDPNSPRDITIDYAESAALPDYIIIDRNYRKMREIANPAAPVTKADPNADKKALRLH